MKALGLMLTLSLLSPVSLQAQIDLPVTLPEREADISKQSTHEQVKLIKVTPDNTELKLNTFCLTAAGNILAGCNTGSKEDGNGSGVIREFDAAGKHLRDWNVPVDPEAINVAPDGTVLVAGDGRLFRYSASGKLIMEADAPHYKDLQANADEIRKQVIEQFKSRANAYESIIEAYETRVAKLKKKEEPTETDKRLIKAYERSLKSFREAQGKTEKQPGPSKEQIDQQVTAMIKYKTGISSISSDGENVFVATRALKGYGYAIWRTNPEFGKAKQIVSGLSGCCGQMDVQAGKNGIYVAENSRHRVVCYDSTGEELLKWGKSDRKGVEGFSSCCNPMNVCFGKNGDVYTAESSSGRIKRFDSKGKLLDYVGDVKLVPGCKKVSIAVSPDGSHVYMLDITKNHIIVMKSKPKEEKTEDKTAAR